MTMFGIKETVVATLVRQIACGSEASGDDVDLTTAEVAERFARATWTGIAEPGDRVAGALVSALGAADALTTVVDRWPVAQQWNALADSRRRGLIDDLSETDLAAAGDRWRPRLTSGTALVALQQAARFGVSLLVPGDEPWPSGVDDLGQHAPIALWVRGSLDTVRSLATSIALVGARAATGYGEHVTMEASAGLVDRGYTIVSGAAYGIDGMAHRAALASSGQTVAFLAGGVDRFYPSGHDALLSRIAETGAVISELPCGSSPTKWRFLQRNRLIAAASLATVVMEAGWRSGSLNTAGHAAALGRPLGAVPGHVTSAASAGCHRLIREFDAVCVTTPDEMTELAPLGLPRGRVESGSSPAGSASSLDEATPRSSDAVRVHDALSTRAPRTTQDLAARAGLSVGQVQSVLGLLELERRVASRERGWVRVGK